MSSRHEDDEIPVELARLADQPRVLVRRAGAPSKAARSVVYWMQRAVRIQDNPALDVAIEAANLGLPVVVYFGVIPNYPNANLRHYHFLQQGLRDAAQDAAERGVGFVVRRRLKPRSKNFLKRSRPRSSSATKIPAASRSAGAKFSPAGSRFPTGPSMPTSSFLRASSTAALCCCTTFACASKRNCPSSSSHRRSSRPFTLEPPKPVASFALTGDITAGFAKLDRSVKPVDTFTGGTHAALKRLGTSSGTIWRLRRKPQPP